MPQPEQRPYQIAGSKFLQDRGRAILADAPGVGKTNQLLCAAQGRTLVLSPALLADVWATEANQWRPDLDLHWMSYTGLCKRIPAEPNKPASMVLPTPRIDTEWDTIICDEAHYVKNRKANHTKAVTKLKTDRLYLATGTPLPNWGHEIFMMLRLLYPGDKRFTNYWRWVNDHFKTWDPPWGGTQIQGLLRGLTWQELAEDWGLSDRWLRRTLDEVLPDLPPMTEQVIRVKMGKEQNRAYRELEEHWYTTLPETGQEVVSWHDGGIYSKMLQCSTGLSTLNAEESPKASAKLQLLRELMRDRDEPTVLFCAFTETAEATARAVRDAGHTCGVVSSRYPMKHRREVIDDFTEGRTSAIVGTVGTMAEGLTLTRADTNIFVERSPRAISNEQAKYRIRRFGQTRPTISIDLVTEDSVDEDLYKLLGAKGIDIEGALTGLALASARKG